LLGADVTSTSSLFAAIENIFWLTSALFVMIMFMRNRRLAFFGALAPSLLFMSIYCVAAGAYEGNMGTAFRHKSLILWVVILLLVSTIVATKERKAENRELTS
jgi:putative Ca2+/H+ antiporter (TMEM165/GDT1 family)